METSGHLNPTNDATLYDLIYPGYNYANEDVATVDAGFTSGTYTGRRFQSREVFFLISLVLFVPIDNIRVEKLCKITGIRVSSVNDIICYT